MAKFIVEKNTFTITGELFWNQENEFADCVKELKDKFDDIILDISKTSFIFSSFMGHIAAMHFECQKLNKKLTVYISEKHKTVFELAGFTKILDLHVKEAAK